MFEITPLEVAGLLAAGIAIPFIPHAWKAFWERIGHMSPKPKAPSRCARKNGHV